MKMLIGLILVFIGAPVWAATESIVLSRTNKMGVSAVDRLSRDGDKYSLNFKPVPKEKRSAALVFWKLASQISQSAPCGPGKFVVVLNRDKKTNQISGCAYGPEYGKLVAALRKLK